MDWNESSQFSSSVDEAAHIASRFIAAREAEGAGRDRQVRQIATEARLRPSWLRSLLQPSRRPKSLCLDSFRRLKRAYLKYLERRLAEIETEIMVIKAMDSVDLAGEGLLARAEAVVSEIKAITAPK